MIRGRAIEYGDWCRHCDYIGDLTAEHVPARSSGNVGEMRLLDETGKVLHAFRDGHAIPVLCSDCNQRASQRGLPLAYKQWRSEVIKAIKLRARHQRLSKPFDVWRSDQSVEIHHGYDNHPGRIVRQVVGMILAVQQSPQLREEFPQLLRAYRSDAAESIEPLTLHVALYNGNFAYFSDEAVAVSIQFQETSVQETSAMERRLWTLAFTPFLITLMSGQGLPWRACPIHTWLAHPTGYHFRKRDRTTVYPVADRTHPLVAMFYEAGR